MKKIYQNTANLYAGIDNKRMVGVINLDRITKGKSLKIMSEKEEVGFIDCNNLLSDLEVQENGLEPKRRD